MGTKGRWPARGLGGAVFALALALGCSQGEPAPDAALDEGLCVDDSECDDGVWCNGPEVCLAGSCVPGEPPCGSTACMESCGCADLDGDGALNEACGGADCDDADASTYPHAFEVCDDRDNDCDVTVDESCRHCGPPPGPYGTSIGHRFEGFTLDDCEGEPVSVYESVPCPPQHEVTVVDFVGEWCAPCQEHTRYLRDTIHARFGDRVRVIQVFFQTTDYGAPTQDDCSAWVRRFELPFEVLIDPAQTTAPYFPSGTLPQTLVVDRRGIIRDRQTGAGSETNHRLLVAVQNLLDE